MNLCLKLRNVCRKDGSGVSQAKARCSITVKSLRSIGVFLGTSCVMKKLVSVPKPKPVSHCQHNGDALCCGLCRVALKAGGNNA